MFFFRNTNSSNVNGDLKKEIEENAGIIVDVRSAGERSSGVLPNAIGADWLSGEVHTMIQSWDPEKHYYMYCRSGNRSGMATKFMKAQGFKNVTNIGAYDQLADLF